MPRHAPARPATCAPTGDLTRPNLTTEVPCRHCGVTLHLSWSPDGRDPSWPDADGRHIAGDPPAPFATGYELLAHLATNAGSGDYGALRARIDLGGLWPWEHRHHGADRPVPDPLPPCPECCGWPMQATRDAWICRVERTEVRYLDPV